MDSTALTAGSDSRQFTHLRLPSERTPDVFDQEDFQATKFINQIYPDESSLGDLDKFMGVLRKQIHAVDKEIFQAVRAQGGAHTKARQDLGSAHAAINELFVKFRDIQRKAEESEALVQDICRDIKKLDTAKKHLTSAITALRRLAMLTAAVTGTLGGALGAVTSAQDEVARLPPEDSFPLRGECVLDDFKILMGTADVKLTTENLDRLANACLVVDALGPRIRDTLMDWLCDREMTIYQVIFSGGGGSADGAGAGGGGQGGGSKLDRFERRFLWFRSRLDEKKENWAIFPDSWRVPQTLALTFCKITKAHLKRILSDDEASMRDDIGPLIKTVVATNKFEKDMAALFGGGSNEAEEDEELESDNVSASEARRRLEKYRLKAKADAQKLSADKVRGSAVRPLRRPAVRFQAWWALNR
ncbi:MAG: hypothetical protein WDW38_010640 [Sanguina aurantia]